MESPVSRPGLVGWLNRHKQRIGAIALGHTAKKAEEVLLDWLIYGAVVVWATSTWGPIKGSLVAFAIMAPFSALMCLLYLRLYDWAKVDWFGFELIKEMRDEESHEHWFGHLLHRLIRLGSIPAFVVLSIHMDPFMTTVYFRHKHLQYQGLTRKDWAIFWGSVLLSNGYWTLRWTVIYGVVLFLWNLLSA